MYYRKSASCSAVRLRYCSGASCRCTGASDCCTYNPVSCGTYNCPVDRVCNTGTKTFTQYADTCSRPCATDTSCASTCTCDIVGTYTCSGSCAASNPYCQNCAHCGDGTCNCGEVYNGAAAPTGCNDCGYCGDGLVNGGDTCSGCEADCGKCLNVLCTGTPDTRGNCAMSACNNNQGDLTCVYTYKSTSTSTMHCCSSSNYKWVPAASACKIDDNKNTPCSTNNECASNYCLNSTYLSLVTPFTPPSTPVAYRCCANVTYCPQPASSACVASGSNNTAGTANKYICRSGTWKKYNSVPCSTGAECDSGTCIDGTCGVCGSGLNKCSIDSTNYGSTKKYCWAGACQPGLNMTSKITVSQGTMSKTTGTTTKFKIKPDSPASISFGVKTLTAGVFSGNLYLVGKTATCTTGITTITCDKDTDCTVNVPANKGGSNSYQISNTSTQVEAQNIKFSDYNLGSTKICIWPAVKGSLYPIPASTTGDPATTPFEICFDSIINNLMDVSSLPTGFHTTSVTVNYNFGHSTTCGANYGSGQLNVTCTVRETGETATTRTSSGSLQISVSDKSKICSGFNVDCTVFDIGFPNIADTFTKSGIYDDVNNPVACSADSDCCKNFCYSTGSNPTSTVCRATPITESASQYDDRRIVYSRETCGFGCMLEETSANQYINDNKINKVCFLQNAHVDYDNDGVKEVCCGRQWHVERGSGASSGEIQDLSVEPCQVCDPEKNTIITGNEAGNCEHDRNACTTGQCHNGECVSKILGDWKSYECVIGGQDPSCCATCPAGASACCSEKLDTQGKCTGCENPPGNAVPYDPKFGTCQLYCTNPSAGVSIDVRCEGEKPSACIDTDPGGLRPDAYCDSNCGFKSCNEYLCENAECKTSCQTDMDCNDGYACDLTNNKCVRCAGALQSSGDAGINKCELGCGASPECDEKDANTCIQTATKAFACTSSCKLRDCGNYKCSGSSCLQTCTNVADCLKGICTGLQCLAEPIPGDVCGRACSKTGVSSPSNLNRTGYCKSTGANLNSTNVPHGSACLTGKDCCGICLDSDDLDPAPDICSEPVAGRCGTTCSTDTGTLGKLDEVGQCKQSGSGSSSYNQLLNEPCRSGMDCCSCVCVLPPCERDQQGKCKSPCIEDTQTHACIPVGFCWEEQSEQVTMREEPGWYFSIFAKPAVSPGVCKR